MCFNQPSSGAFALLGLFVSGWIVRKTNNRELAAGVFYFFLMEALQFVQYFYIAENMNSSTCDEIINKVLTFLGFVHICYQPYFCHVINASLTQSEKYRAQYVIIKRLCLLGGTALLARYFLAEIYTGQDMTTLPDGMQSPSTEWLRGEKLCTAHGKFHLSWSIPMAESSYYIPSAFIHFFLMYAPFVALYEKRGMIIQGVFLFLTGPFLASFITPYLMEQASIWCFFSIAQISSMLFLIREALIVRWGKEEHKISIFKQHKAGGKPKKN